MRFHRGILKLDAEAESHRIAEAMRRQILDLLKRDGGVIGVSGGVDSAVMLALAVKALGRERVTALLLPEMESSPESALLGRQVCRVFGVDPIVEDVTGALLGFDCYRRRDEAVRSVFPEYDSTYTLKITLPGQLLDRAPLNVFSVTIVSPEGEEQRKRLRADQLRQIVAASNFKQRSRAAMLYYHAELRHYAVIGTAPKNEHDLGFFVKHGDSAVDVKPIAHLYKTQVFQLAEHLGVPQAIRQSVPTTDTYTADSSQQEFFFRLPFEELDLLMFGWDHGIPASEVASEMGLRTEQVERVYQHFAGTTRTTAYLRTPPLGVESDSDAPLA